MAAARLLLLPVLSLTVAWSKAAEPGTCREGWDSCKGMLHGVKKFSNGGEYTGDFQDGKQHGHGVFTMAGARYEGSWRSGFPHGAGVFVGADGDRYDGEYVNDQR